jgi:KDO2-lipid IV(A) lauroyltransferase
LSESGFVWFNSFKHNAKHIVKTKGAQYLQGDENTILLVPHFGCWEITARVVSFEHFVQRKATPRCLFHQDTGLAK